MIPLIKTYSKDKRLSLNRVYNNLSKLDKNLWIKEILYLQDDKKYQLPILSFKTKKKGKALYLIAGIHGEEPAGINAIAKNIYFLNKLAKKIPIILIPLANSKAYRRNWRYPDLKRYSKTKPFLSVGDADPYLNKKTNKKISEEAKAIISFIIKNYQTYQPVLVLDFHEDDSKTGAYIFSHGKLSVNDPIAKEIVKILKKKGFKFYRQTKTRFNEAIIDGIIGNIKDNSIDEFLASSKIIIKNKIKQGPNAPSVIVIETTSKEIPLKKRVKAHSKILKMSGKFYEIAKSFK